jgi:[acyl-carrier-protein] S-malonyltransferase
VYDCEVGLSIVVAVRSDPLLFCADMKVVALFSGQGAQKVGMGRDFYESSATARAMLDHADDELGFALSQIMFQGPEEQLMRTSRCQPALYLHGLIALALLSERVAEFDIVATAGLSLGELTAHAAAKTFTFEDGLRLAMRRGEFMEKSCEETDGAMAALIGGEESAVRELAALCDVDIANLNAPGQIVLSGTAAGIDAVAAKYKDFGIRRAIKLNVAGAYHSRLMRSAQELLTAEMAGITMHRPQIPVICNYSAGNVSDPAEIRTMLEKQVTGSVRWTESIQALCAQGHRRFIEFGPGRVLAGLMGKINPEAELMSIEDLAGLEAVIEKWG